MTNKNGNQKQGILLNECLKKIEQKLEWPDAQEWSHRHFERLSEKIWQDTKVRLSAVTLKRLWGKVSYDSFPSISTLDALAKFIGYESWIAYQQETNKLSQGSKQALGPSLLKSIKLNFKKYAYLLGFLLVITLAAFIVFTNDSEGNDQADVSFDFEPVTLGIPNTVTFTYDVKGSDADSVFIQQSWDPKLRHEVNMDDNFYASTYYYPGSYRAKLILNDQIVSEKDLHITSNGWLGTIEKSPVPFYLDYEEISRPGMIEIIADHLKERGFDLNKEIPYTHLHMVDDFGVPADNFKMITEFRNTSGMGESVCQKTRVLILCSETPFIIPFSIKGCTGELKMKIPDKFIDGQKNDLSGFGVDFSDWVRLEVAVANGLLNVMLNDSAVFQSTLPVLSGKVAGVRYQFHGTGAVKSLEIQSGEQVKFKSAF